MIDIQKLASEVYKMLEQVADLEYKEWAKRNYPTAMQVLGAKVPELRKVVKEVSMKLREASAQETIEMAKALVASSVFECQQVAYESLSLHKAAMKSLRTADLVELGHGLDNWLSVDAFATLVAGPAWRDRLIPEKLIEHWANSENRWWRRVAVVCTVALNQKARGGIGDATRTINICGMVASDQDEMVAKALSWALRELVKREPEPVVAFIEKHEAVLPARVKREVCSKIKTGRK